MISYASNIVLKSLFLFFLTSFHEVLYETAQKKKGGGNTKLKNGGTPQTTTIPSKVNEKKIIIIKNIYIWINFLETCRLKEKNAPKTVR